MYSTEEINGNRGKYYLLLLVLCKTCIKTLGFRNTLSYFIKSGRVNEDFYFSKWALHAWRVRANLPSCEEASYFSFEVNPSYLYDLNGKLPFGCHAFEKWESDIFWSKYIQVST